MSVVMALTVLLQGVAPAHAQARTLDLYFTHTKENLKIVYKRNGRYVGSALRDLNRFLRDWRRNESTKMDPELFDLLWEVQQEFGGKKIHIVSAYRSPATNSMLRRRSRGVAKNSQHMAGRAIDFFIPGANTAKVRAAGMKRQVGGVGYYTRSNFVHFDTARVRSWPRMSRSQLAKMFPNGKTLHLPSNGKALSGYDAALKLEKAGKLASLRTRGGDGRSLFAFGGSGRQVASNDRQRGILPQRGQNKPTAQARRKKDPADEPAKVRTASLGPVATNRQTAAPKRQDDGDDGDGGFFRQLPGASLGGLINRFRSSDTEAGDDNGVTPVALPSAPLSAVSVNDGAAASEDAIGSLTERSRTAAPIPRLAPRPAASPESDPLQEEGGPGEPIELAALPPQRPGYDAIGAELSTGALGYASDAGVSGPRGSALNATAAFVPEVLGVGPNPFVPGAVRPKVKDVPLVSASLSPVRGASPLLIAESSGIEDGAFSGFVAPDRDAASKEGLLMADSFLGAPTTFGSATNWLDTKQFSGLRITVYARPRS
ncbi:MAG: DUF882 domain-containing protein [Pseudomonadota bacterium]